MAAAVADYPPEAAARRARSRRRTPLTLTLVRTPDILAELVPSRRAVSPVLVGFAAEAGNPVARGRAKLVRKAVNLIVANTGNRRARPRPPLGHVVLSSIKPFPPNGGRCS